MNVMKRMIKSALFVGASVLIMACTDEATPDTPQATASVDLSAQGTANCYLVTAAGSYSFDATVIGNGAAGIIDPERFHITHPAIAPVSAGLVWQDAYADGRGMVTSVALNDDRTEVVFEVPAPFRPGNALIAVYDAGGTVLWSWHIWMPDADVEAEARTSATGYRVMNRNLGAQTAEAADPRSYGMLYQWGRKDPFPAAASLTGTTATLGAPLYDAQGAPVPIGSSSRADVANNTLVYALQHPTTCLSNNAQYASSRDWLKAGEGSDALWGNPQGAERDAGNQYPYKGTKSCYDPCPAGWRVPPADVFRNATPSGGYAWEVADFNVADANGDGLTDLNDYRYGWVLRLDEAATSYFPAAARFDGSYAMLMGSMSGLWGSYWGNAPSLTLTGGAFAVLSFQVKTITGADEVTLSPAGSASRADAFSVRCIQEN
jgi:hypothetical protein